jgi:hypothetical protein
MSRTARPGAETAEVGAAIDIAIDDWIALQDLVDVDWVKERSEAEAAARTELSPPVRGLLDHVLVDPVLPAAGDARVRAAVARASDRFIHERIQPSKAYVWMSGRDRFLAIESEISAIGTRSKASVEGLRSENRVKFFRVLIPHVIRWAVLRDARETAVLRRVSFTKEQMLDAATKAEDLAELLKGVLDTRSKTANSHYVPDSYDVRSKYSKRLGSILQSAALEWRAAARSTSRGVREDGTTLDRQFISDLSSGLFEAFSVDCRKHAEGLARVFGITLHRSTLSSAAKVRGKGSE